MATDGNSIGDDDVAVAHTNRQCSTTCCMSLMYIYIYYFFILLWFLVVSIGIYWAIGPPKKQNTCVCVRADLFATDNV